MQPVTFGAAIDSSWFYEADKRIQDAIKDRRPDIVKAILLDWHIISADTLVKVWHAFPELCFELLANRPDIARKCPLSVAHQYITDTAKIAKLFECGFEITREEFLEYAKSHPECVSQIIMACPQLATECPPEALEQLADRNCERVFTTLVETGAKADLDGEVLTTADGRTARDVYDAVIFGRVGKRIKGLDLGEDSE